MKGGVIYPIPAAGYSMFQHMVPGITSKTTTLYKPETKKIKMKNIPCKKQHIVIQI